MTVSTRFPNNRIRVIYASSAKKDVYGCLEKIIQYASKVHLVVQKHNRAMKLDDLVAEKDNVCAGIVVDHNKPIFQEIVAEGDIKQTLDDAFKQSSETGEEEVVVICGTFFMMQEVNNYFKLPYESDPFELNETQMPKK